MPLYIAHLDFETSDHAGAGGMFQVTSLEEFEEDERGVDRITLIDQGKHYASLDELQTDIAAATGVPVEQIVLEQG